MVRFGKMTQAGSSIAELMVAMSIMSISLLTVGTIAQQSAEVRRYQNVQADHDRIIKALEDRVRFNRICTETFEGVSLNLGAGANNSALGVNEVALTVPGLSPGIATISQNTLLTLENIRITSLRVTNLKVIPDTLQVDADTGIETEEYLGLLRIQSGYAPQNVLTAAICLAQGLRIHAQLLEQ